MTWHAHDSWQRLASGGGLRTATVARARLRQPGHAHFWERAAISRRRFLQASAGTALAVFGAGLWRPALAGHRDDGDADPVPIPGGIELGGTLFHLFLPEPGNEPSTITDFDGVVGLAVIDGFGTDDAGRRLPFEADMRFMKGVYVGEDGRHHRGTFGFV